MQLFLEHWKYLYAFDPDTPLFRNALYVQQEIFKYITYYINK